MADLFLRIADDGQSVLFAANADNQSVPTRELLIEQLISLGAEKFYFYEKAIDSALAVTIRDDEPSPETAYPEPIVIAERRNASLVVKTDSDFMRAAITVTAPYGGNHATGADILEALKQNRIVKGIRKTQLHQLLQRAQSLQPGEKLTLPVAFGRLPENGVDVRFESLVDDASQRILKPQATDDGKVDMRDLGELITVRAGQTLMRRIPATEGVAGFTVEGKALPAKPGKDSEFQPGDGTIISEQDSNLLLAEKSGIPVAKPRGMQVDEALTLKGVNVATGHINFDGSILITGDVTPGMKVTASGNITVAGFVELAELKAGGDISIIKGIIGRKLEGNKLGCTIEAAGSVTSKFAQFADITCGQNALFTLHVLHSTIHAEGEVIVMDQFKRQGSLSGGVTEAGYSIRAINLGALSGVPTVVTAFTKFECLLQQLQDKHHDYQVELQNVEKIKQAKLKLLKLPEHRRPVELSERINNAAEQHKSQIDLLHADYQQLRGEYDELRSRVTITALNRLYAGVQSCLEKEHLLITQDHGPSKLHIFEHVFQCSPL
ncbi:DUF342 domain-containing protein [Photobacterium lutimaris]|uniref:DUF342 domain-containing protein n=1 Tax=Photobacterium lutimaris TaxID=388278 RepID=A0A2T3IYF7_9GAMM|nr:FapA family protein [Photobacterium lutimaris]PSU33592.1 DUF342 domain-containing protein [Photobacterium lutimaris]TDR74563.1 hypothetical protein DFP78_107150 [Photobacterium lutimaris]